LSNATSSARSVRFARAVHQRRHEPFVSLEVCQPGLDFLAGHDDRQAFGLAGADDVAQVVDFVSWDRAMKEQQRRKHLVLR